MSRIWLWIVTVIIAGQPLQDALARTAAYVARLQDGLTAVVSDEHYQQVLRSRGSVLETRLIDAEVLYLWLATDRSWITVRNVVAINGRRLSNASSLDDSLSKGIPVSMAKLFDMRSYAAELNSGSVDRDFNDPLLPLQCFVGQNASRFLFHIGGMERVNGLLTTKLQFQEKRHPTLVQEHGIDRPSNGTVWIVDDGTIIRTRFDTAGAEQSSFRGEVGIQQLVTSTEVEYGSESNLRVMVPHHMHETYTILPRGMPSVNAERIDTEATYSNFREYRNSAVFIQ